MSEQLLSKNGQAATTGRGNAAGVFQMYFMLLVAVVVASAVFLSFYRPGPRVPPPTITLEQKMAHLQTGAPLPGQETRLVVPRWMMVIILGFTVIQIFPLVLAAHTSRLPQLTRRDLRQIEFLTETPVFLGLLGTLVGVCMTQFISSTLAAPLAYLTTISGIVLYLFGRFTILLSLPSSTDSTQE